MTFQPKFRVQVSDHGAVEYIAADTATAHYLANRIATPASLVNQPSAPASPVTQPPATVVTDIERKRDEARQEYLSFLDRAHLGGVADVAPGAVTQPATSLVPPNDNQSPLQLTELQARRDAAYAGYLDHVYNSCNHEQK